MEEIKKVNVEAFKWLDKIQKDMWARSHFHHAAKSDHIKNNMSKSFNNWIGELRSKPVLTLVENLVMKVLDKLQDRYSDSLKWENLITPNALKKIEEARNRTSRCSLMAAGRLEFNVSDDGLRHVANLRKQECTCCYWQSIGLPFKHAMACISYLRHDLFQYCDGFYTKVYYQLAYYDVIHLVPDLSTVEFPENEDDIVEPPVLKRHPGKPREKRRQEETANKAIGTRKRSTTVRCLNCK